MALINTCIGCGSKSIDNLGTLGKLPNCNHFELSQQAALDYERKLAEESSNDEEE